MTTPTTPTAVLNLVCWRGVTFQRTLTYKDAAGVPVNWQTYELTISIRGPDGALVTPSIADGHITLSPDGLTATWTLPDTETSTYPPGIYSYQVLARPSGLPNRLLFTGQFQVF